VVKLSAPKAGAVSLGIALIVALAFFGLSAFGLIVAVSKALSLSLFVLLIVWGALLLFHLADGFKAIEVIHRNFALHVKDKFMGFLMLAWLFSGMFQGMSGFGVPVVIVAPILIALGFDKAKSLAATLIGHSWAVTFGSMGSAFYINQMMTGIPYKDLEFPMWVFNTVALLLTGLGVCWVYGGFKGIKGGLPFVLPVSALMSAVQYITISLGFYSIVSLTAAIAGLLVMFGLYKLREKEKSAKEKSAKEKLETKLTLLQSVLPYVVILALAVAIQFLPSILRGISLSFDFPGTETALGYVANPETGFARIRLFGHPALLLLTASVIAALIYKRAGVWDIAVFKKALRKTAGKGVPATLALLFLGSMSMVMKDSGMTDLLANNVADLAGGSYPLFAPFFGVLGSFLTGNNTNSNILFGSFQFTIAQRLGLSGAVMSAAQSLSGSIGVALSPTLALVGGIAAKFEGQESLVYRKTVGVVLLTALVMGIVNLVIIANF